MNTNCIWERLEWQVMSGVCPLTKESRVYPPDCNKNCFWILAIKININKDCVLISLMLRLSVLNYAHKGTWIHSSFRDLSPPQTKNKGAGKILFTRAVLQWRAVTVGSMCSAYVAPTFLLIEASSLSSSVLPA